MLHGIDPRMTPDLMDCLMRMGHGDEIAIVDRNYPATSTASQTEWGEAIYLPGLDTTEAIALITTLLPLDGFADFCAWRMEIDGEPDSLGPVHEAALAHLGAAKPEDAPIGSISRQGFYEKAGASFAVIVTTDNRPFGCFMLRKGVIF